MVQVLPNRPKMSTAQQATQALRSGFQAYNEARQYQEAKLSRENENQALLQKGLDLRGISDPDARKLYIQSELQASNAKSLQQMKDQSKQDRLNRLGSLLGSGDNNSSQNLRNPLTSEDPQDMSPQAKGFNPANIPDNLIAEIALEDPQTARVLQQQKTMATRENRAEREFEFQKQKASPEHQREQHIESAQAQADVKYNQQLEEASKQHALKEQTLNRLEVLNKKGVTGKPYEKLLEKAGLVNFTSEGRREFAADVKNLITDIRSILGAQFTGFEFQTILNAYPNADFSKEANEAIIRNLKDFQDIKSKEVEYARQIKKDNRGKLPADFQSQVNEKVHEYAQSKLPTIKQNISKIMNNEYGIPKGKTLMFDTKGEPLSVPEDQIEKYIQLGASLP